MKIKLLLTAIVLCCTFLNTLPLLAEEMPVPVTLATVKATQIDKLVHLTGSVLARRTAHLSAEIAGKVEKLWVDEGDQVKQEDLLLHIKAKPKQLELKQAQAQQQYRQALLNELQAGTRPEEIAAQKADVAHAEHSVALAKTNATRIAKLWRSKSISQEEYDSAQAELQRAQALLTREQMEYQLARKGARSEVVAAALAQLEDAQAQVEQLTDQIARHDIRAPFKGVISQKLTEIGNWVNPGDEVLTLTEVDALRVEFALPQKYYHQVIEGTPVDIQFDAMPEQKFTAPVQQKIPVGSQTARTFPVRVEINNADQQKASGMSARITLYLKENTAKVLLVPVDAVMLTVEGTQSVWLAKKSGDDWIASEVRIHTGRTHLDHVEVTEGAIQAGDHVIIRGNETLRPAQKVMPISKRVEKKP